MLTTRCGQGKKESFEHFVLLSMHLSALPDLLKFATRLQTGQYSTQIFSLAVLLSSLFVYNQMGGIDEAALDRLSLVTEMTRHIRVKAGSSSGMLLHAAGII